jgi:hypothetical protein
VSPLAADRRRARGRGGDSAEADRRRSPPPRSRTCSAPAWPARCERGSPPGSAPPGGRLIVSEHAWHRLDEPTARWYLEQRAATDPGGPSSPERCLDEWAADHAGLHTSAAMRTELDRHFEERFFVWTPYLNRELGDVVDERAERALIEAGAIRPPVFATSAERPAAPAQQMMFVMRVLSSVPPRRARDASARLPIAHRRDGAP